MKQHKNKNKSHRFKSQTYPYTPNNLIKIQKLKIDYLN